MKTISNYSQPDFYNFTEDSLELAKFVANYPLGEFTKGLDLCAGCGVVGIEILTNSQKPIKMTFLELQKHFIPYLEKNINLAEIKDARVIQNSIGEQKFKEESFDFIVCNPPYFISGEGRISPDVKRQISRTFEVDSWDILLEKSYEWLKPQGFLFLSTRTLNPIEKYKNKFEISKKEKLPGCWLVALTRLDVD